MQTYGDAVRRLAPMTVVGDSYDGSFVVFFTYGSSGTVSSTVAVNYAVAAGHKDLNHVAELLVQMCDSIEDAGRERRK
jgi:hypothetical protein